MIFRLQVDANGRVDVEALPRLLPGAMVELSVPDDDTPIPPPYGDYEDVADIRGLISTKKPDLTDTEAILVTTAALYHSPKSDDEDDWVGGRLEQALDRITYAFRESVYNAFRGDPMIEDGRSVHFAYLDREGTNARRCSQCGMWLTDERRADSLQGLMNGYEVGDEFLCDQHYEIAIGLLPGKNDESKRWQHDAE